MSKSKSKSKTKQDTSADAAQLSSLPSNISCLLVSLSTNKLVLLPNSAVAEVLPIADYDASSEGPEWHVGSLEWRGLSIPLVSLEVMSEEDWQEGTNSPRIAVFNGCVDGEALPFYGVVIQGIPRLVRVSSQSVTVREGELANTEDMLVSVNGEPAVIPKLSYIEERLISEAVSA